ncbi:MAG: class I SAM-dependent methyltransferase [Deltaproteobacteria bacterium]|nr:MAG: class I SAM-dependent methyltransferase [Deltaproteobacteria bacterium]
MIPISCASCAGALSPRLREVEDPQTRERFDILACRSCGLGHTSPVPEDLGRYYGRRYYGGRHGLTQALCLWRRARLLDRFGGKGRVLDVGCGDGSFLDAARARGWEVAGTERNPAPPRSKELQVFRSIAEASGPFSSATLWHSLEHLPDPRGALEQLRALLEPRSTVLVAVPDAQGAQARLFGRLWRHLDVPRHLFHFGRESLARLLERAGFTPYWWWHQEIEYDLLGWTQSALNALPATHDLLLRALSGRHRSAGDLFAGVLLGALLGVAAFPAAMATALLGSGGTLIVAARRA